MKNNNQIQQLRGLSILFIMIYHYIKHYKTSGYLSVSIFLQISGYIITYSSINKAFSSIDFYYRRIVNIFPQLFVTILFIILFIPINSYNKIINLYNDILAVIKMQSNIYFYHKEVDYFSQFDNPSYVLHFWYISLLQQIYFIYPVLFKVYKKYLQILFSMCGISFILFSVNIFKTPSFAYYLIICRIHEYILGIIVNSYGNNYYFSFISHNAIVYIMITIQICDIKVNILVKYILINILSFILMGIFHLNLTDNSFILNNTILKNIGNKSYELYLIHYPLIFFHLNSHLKYVLLLLLLVYILSIIRIINKFTLFLISIILICIILNYIYYNKKILSDKYKNMIILLKIDPMKEYYKAINEIKNYDPMKIKKNECYLLLGDSHIQQWLPSIIRLAKIKKNCIIHQFFHANDIEKNNLKYIFVPLKKYKKYIFTIISSFFMSNEYIKNMSYFNIAFKKYIYIALNYSQHIYIINDIPFLHDNPLNCLYSKNEKNICFALLGKNASLTSIPYIQNKYIKYCNMEYYICENNRIPFLKNGIIVYKDNNHLTLSFSDTLSDYVKKCLTRL